MRYFDEQLITNHPRQHGVWWNELIASREYFHLTEEALAEVSNASSILPRDAWLDLDTITRSVMRNDEGQAYMADLMPLAKPVHIGKLVNMYRQSSDVGDPVIRSMSGQVPVPLDKVTYTYEGTPIPIFQKGYFRNWREWNSLQSENFDALADDQEATTSKIKRDQALYVLNGDSTIVFEGYSGYGIKTHPNSKSINLGSAVGGANINLTTATSDAIEAFINGPFGALLDDNKIGVPVNLYVSPEIARNLDKPYSLSAGFKTGSMRDELMKNRRIAKITTTFELTGNEFFWFVPNSNYIRPLVGLAISTFAVPRNMPTANYNFELMGALGLEIRADFNGASGVGYSVVVN